MKHRGVIAALVVGACLWVGCNSAFAVTFSMSYTERVIWNGKLQKPQAVRQAKAQGKKILLVAGRFPACAKTAWTLVKAVESTNPAIRSLIQRSFIPWYADVDNDGFDLVGYRPTVVYELPLICVIDPYNNGTYLARTVDAPLNLQAFYDWLRRYATAVCTADLDHYSDALTAASSTGHVIHVTASSGCSWTASSGDSWITITAGSTGTGNRSRARFNSLIFRGLPMLTLTSILGHIGRLVIALRRRCRRTKRHLPLICVIDPVTDDRPGLVLQFTGTQCILYSAVAVCKCSMHR